MPANVRQFGGLEARVLFYGPERVGCLDGSVLARVTGENDPAAVPFDERQQFQHLFAADLSGLVHQDNRVTSHGTAREKGTDCFGAGEPVSFQVSHLLTLWSEHLNRTALLLERRMHLPEGVTLARSCTTPEQRHEIPRGEDLLDGLTLFGIQGHMG